jgi:hypothetical protein
VRGEDNQARGCFDLHRYFTVPIWVFGVADGASKQGLHAIAFGRD